MVAGAHCVFAEIRVWVGWGAAVVLLLGQGMPRVSVAETLAQEPPDFVVDVFPILAMHCHRCHGSQEESGGLRLDSRASVSQGGESGKPAIERFHADRSPLIMRITSDEPEWKMPPEGERVSPREIETLRRWIAAGASWPDQVAGPNLDETAASTHWAFQPVRYSPPVVGTMRLGDETNAIDTYIDAQLDPAGLTRSQPAPRPLLARRLYLDTLGVPPEPEAIQDFVLDTSPTAWERLVDRVLSSPRFGERWASHWLDVIRYGDTHGFEVNTPRDHAWPYRDYVIDSFNADKPYSDFVREQIAGDLLGADVATGFLVAAPALLPGQIGRDEPSMRQARADELHEVVVSVGSGILGLTIGCARCHQHKFDPFLQRDYFRLQAVFAGLRYGERALNESAARNLLRRVSVENQPFFGGRFVEPDTTFRLARGDPMQRREEIAADIPSLFGSLGLRTETTDADRRCALAQWLADSDNPLPARVIVNRLWQHHFGAGIVTTPSDFGKMGRPPTHPELLDYLAGLLIRHDWSLKAVHRQILVSATYCQSSGTHAAGLSIDAQSTLLWRYPSRRLDMEPVRDTILTVCGSLDLTMGGPGFALFRPNDNYVRVYDPREEWGPDAWRRMIYAHRVRMAQDGVFGAFDCPDAGQPAPLRGRSTTAIQALNLMHGEFIAQQAECFAARVQREAGSDLLSQLQRMFQLTLGRDPSDTETTVALEAASRFGLTPVARALLNSSEFLWIP